LENSTFGIHIAKSAATNERGEIAKATGLLLTRPGRPTTTFCHYFRKMILEDGSSGQRTHSTGCGTKLHYLPNLNVIILKRNRYARLSVKKKNLAFLSRWPKVSFLVLVRSLL